MHMQSSPETVAGLSASWSTVAAFAAGVDRGLDAWLADTHRVGLTDFRALTLLSRASDKELRVNDLAKHLGLNQSSATRLVSRLETKGLARRDLCPDDARGVYAVITDAGESLLRDVRPDYENRLTHLVAHQTDRAELRRSLSEVGALLGD